MNLEEESLKIDESIATQKETSSKTSRKSKKAKRKKWIYEPEDDFEQNKGEIENESIEPNDEEIQDDIPFDDIDDFIKDGSEEDMDTTNEENIEVGGNVDTCRETDNTVSSKIKRSKKKQFPLEPEEDFQQNEDDFEQNEDDFEQNDVDFEKNDDEIENEF